MLKRFARARQQAELASVASRS